MVARSKYFTSKPFGPVLLATFLLLQLLVLFGTAFSKFRLVGPIHLYDFLLILVTLWAVKDFTQRPSKIILWPTISLVAISGAYLLWSLSWYQNDLDLSVRQYALFGYVACYYLIVYSFISGQTLTYLVRFMVLLGVSGAAIQLGYHLFNLLSTSGYLQNLFTDFNFYSHIGFMAIFVLQAATLCFLSNIWKWFFLGAIMLCLLTMGHQSSTIVTLLTITGAFFFIRAGLRLKLLLVAALVALPVLLFNFVPSYFQDHNSLWRLIYWKLTLKEMILDYYAVLGHGFGVKYVNQEILDALRTQINSPWMEVRPEEQFLSPPHNSFLTIAFHIGLVWLVLLVIPLMNAIRYLFNRSAHNPSPSKDFLLISLIGVTTWSCFHVVLELPHSSGFYWLIYFTTIYAFNYADKESTPTAVESPMEPGMVSK